MEDKIEIGEYCRTNDGIIGIKVEYDNGLKLKIDKDEYYKPLVDSIVKHSKNIIDLIEVGDFVNGFPILEPIYNGNTMYGIDEGYENFKKSFGEIKTILTKEQFEANCYKVGGKNNEQE